MSRMVLAMLALVVSAAAQTSANYVADMTDDNMVSTLASTKQVVLAMGNRTWVHNTEMDHALFMAAQATPNVKFARAELDNVQALASTLQLKYAPAYIVVTPGCDKIVVAYGLKDVPSLQDIVKAGQSCSVTDTSKLAPFGRAELLKALHVTVASERGMGFSYGIDKPLACIVVGAPDEGEKLMQPVVISAQKPLVVGGVIESSPADHAGIKVGDRILAINGVTVDGASMQQVVKRVQESGGKLTLTLSRSKAESFSITVHAAEYTVLSSTE